MISGYNLENEILNIAGLKNFYPLLSGYDHGWAMRKYNAINSTKNNLSKYHFVWNKRVYDGIKEDLKDKSPIITGCPYRNFKDRNNISALKKKNSLYFYVHSTNKISIEQKINVFLDSLNKLSKNLKPIDICLHWHDYKNKNLVRYLKNEGYKIFCAGNIYSTQYMENLYKIIRNYNHCLSNQLGTYSLLSIDLKIPFTILDPEPEYFNFGRDLNVPGEYRVSDFKFGNIARKKFLNKFNIDQDLIDFVNFELGVNDKEESKLIKKIILSELKDSMDELKFKKISKYFTKKIYETFSLILK
jgi:hypothetical protein|tara:strand:- start:2727 stop:3629 length:903 start_codon:yes stop_codon:yes gene_type:complete